MKRHLISRYQVGSPIKMKAKTLPTAQVFGNNYQLKYLEI
jgi:hypothetical protein